jgi:hypothetical protein
LFTLPQVSPGPGALGSLATASFFSGIDGSLRNPVTYQWNVTVEREFGMRMTGRVSYIGAQSIGMAERVDLNHVSAGPRPFSPSLRPFAHWVQLVSVRNLGFANYQGLHLDWPRRFRNDLSFQAGYQFAKCRIAGHHRHVQLGAGIRGRPPD